MESQNYPLRVLHGFQLSPDEVVDFASRLMKETGLKNLPGISGISKQRRPVLPFGAMALAQLVKKIKPSSIVTSHYGVREGLLYSLLDEVELSKDPLLSACEDLAVLRSRSPAHSYELCSWTDGLFRGSEFGETIDEGRLRHAACLISDIGWRTHPSFRAERTMASIAYSVYSGIDHAGRAFLSLTSFFRHNGPNAKGEEKLFRGLLSDDLYQRARILGSAIRTAHMISAGVTGIISKTPLFYEGDRLVIELPHPFDALDGERLNRRFQGLGKLLGCETEIRVNPDSNFFGFLGFSKNGK